MIHLMRNGFSLFLLGLALLGNAQTDSLRKDSIKFSDLKAYRQAFWDHPPAPLGHVNDFEGLFTDVEILQLDSVARACRQAKGVEIVIVTIDTSFVEKEQFENLTLHLANTWQIGQKYLNNGILIGISRGHRRMRIQNGFGIVSQISDEETGEVIKNDMRPYFKSGDFFQGTLQGLLKMIALLD